MTPLGDLAVFVTSVPAVAPGRMLKNDWNSHFTVKTPWGRHPGAGDCVIIGLRLTGSRPDIFQKFTKNKNRLPSLLWVSPPF
ncbi:MAG: hypothetical protein ACLP51_09385 [Syntrophobacteraceae bacterium]